MTPSRGATLLVSAALVLSAVIPAAGDDWPGFRGLQHQGVGAAYESPTSWSPTRNILWKTPVRGSGHSSPVVAGDRVFVTTAYSADGTKLALTAARLLRVALCLAVLGLWFLLPVRVHRRQQALAAALVVLLALLAIGDERVFQLTRSAARAWLGAGLSVTVGLLVSAYGLRRTAPARRAIAAALGAIGVVLIARMPGGFAQSRPLSIALATIAGAALVGSLLIFRGAFQPAVSERRRLVTIWRTSALAAATCGLLIPTVLIPRSGVVYAIACVDRADGRVIWMREGLYGARTAVHRANSPATPTAVTDGRRVFAYFGTPGLMAVEADGTLLWTSARAPFETIYGVGASPVLADGTLIVSSFTRDGPYLAAFDAATGQQRWRTSRVSVHPDFGDSRTPLVLPIDGRRVVLVWGMDDLAGYDLETGRLVWRYPHGANHRMGSMVVSMVADGERLYLPLENGMIALSLRALAAGGDPKLWTSRGGASGLSTPVLYDGRIFAVSAAGVASCTDAKTGELRWRARLPGEYYSSPVAMAGNVYFTNDAGTTTVVAAGPTYQVLAENAIDEPVAATMAAVDGHLYLRAHQHLYSIRP